MITVAGEALMDILVDASGTVTALPGGGAFNVARVIARLGGDCQFLGRFSDDAFGRQLRASLEEQRIDLAVPLATPAPTTLAIAKLDGSGSADYRFYLDGTSAAQLEPGDIPPGVLGGSTAVVAGGLGILIEPMASSLLGLLPQAPAEATVLLDPNCRPHAIKDLARCRGAVAAFLRRADIVKVSVDDLALLQPGADSRDAARGLLDLGAAAVLMTNGAAPVAVHTAKAECCVPVPDAQVVDTVGAGDAFVAAFLTWWSDRALSRADAVDAAALVEGTAAAIRVAAAACTVRGANLPDGFRWSNTGPPASIGLAPG
jgi:fructokinase